jgi:hypothetical protein
LAAGGWAQSQFESGHSPEAIFSQAEYFEFQVVQMQADKLQAKFD